MKKLVWNETVVGTDTPDPLTLPLPPSVTGPYQDMPRTPNRDLAPAYGINRPVIHTSIRHPVDDRLPDLSLGPFGQHFNRHETWAEMARPWVNYLARSAYLLQQSRYFADVVYYYGEDTPLTLLYANGVPARPVMAAPC